MAAATDGLLEQKNGGHRGRGEAPRCPPVHDPPLRRTSFGCREEFATEARNVERSHPNRTQNIRRWIRPDYSGAPQTRAICDSEWTLDPRRAQSGQKKRPECYAPAPLVPSAGCVPYRYPATIPVKLPDAMERSLDGLALSLSDDA